MIVSSIMENNFIILSEEDTIGTTVRKGFEAGAVVIVPRGDELHILTPNHIAGMPETRHIMDVPSQTALVLHKDTSLEEALLKMDEANECIAIVVEAGRPVGIVERGALLKHIVEELRHGRELAEQLAAIFRASPIPILVLDDERRVLEMSNALETEFGLQRESAIGKRSGEALRCLHSLDDPRGCGFGPHCQTCQIRNTVLEVIDTGKPLLGREATVPVRVDDGVTHKVFRFSVAPFRHDAGRAVIMTLEDITIEKQMEEREALIAETNRAFAGSKLGEGIQKGLEALRKLVPYEVAGLLVWELGMDGFMSRAFSWMPDFHEQVKAMFSELFDTDGEPGLIPFGVGSFADALMEADGEPLIIGDSAERRYWGDEIRIKHGIRSTLLYPLLWEEEHKVALIMQSREPNAYDDEHIRLLERIAPVLRAVVEREQLFHELKELNATLEKRVRQRTIELEILYELSRQIGYTLNYDELLRLILQSLHRVVSYDIAGSLLITDEVQELFIHYARPTDKSVLDSARQQALSAFKMLSDAPIDEGRLIVHALPAETFDESQQPIVQEMKSFFNVPIIANGRTIGLIFVGSEAEDAYTEEHVRLLYTIANNAAIAIQRLRALLRAEASRLEAILESMTEGVILLDAEGRISVVNAAARQMLPALTKESVGERLTQLGTTNLSDLRERLKHSAEGRVSMEITTAETPQSIFELTASQVQAGELESKEGIVITLRDVTEQREVQQRLEQQERLAAIGQLTGGIAHVFNNMLQGVIGYAEVALEHAADNLQLANDLNNIIDQAQRAAQLVRQLLTFSRQEPAERKPMDLVPLVKETVKLLKRTIPESIGINLQIAPDLWMIEADPTQIQQVLMNLAVNARDAMPEGGEMLIGLENAVLDEAFTQRYPDIPPGKYVCLRVKDTGIGMPPEVLERALEPFFTTKKPGEGTGLGLAQVYGIVKGHDGHIIISSEVGKGTEVHIYLPIAGEAVVEEIAKEKEEEELPRGTETILVVEDNDSVREVAQRMLERLGYTVLVASNGIEGLQVFQEHANEIDLVLTDVVMPKMSGIELVDELRRLKDIKVVMMTGYGSDEAARELAKMRKDVLGFIEKPLRYKQLAMFIRSALDK